MRLLFGEYELDLQNYELRLQGKPRILGPQAFDLLAYLAQHRDRIISRDELFENLWSGKVVSDSTLSSCIKEARKAVGDDGKAQHIIATQNRRGYRFIADVEEQEDKNHVDVNARISDNEILSGAAIDTSMERGELCPFPVIPGLDKQRTSIAVMPFSYNPGNMAITWMADALSEDIGIQLARVPGFIVISRNSTSYYRNREFTITQVGQELGTQYVIEGSLWERGGSIRVSVQLLDTATNSMLWADRAEIPSDKLDKYLDDVVNKIVGSIEPELNRAELHSLRKRKSVDLGAWELYRQGHAILGLKGWSEESFAECANLLREAIKKDPELAFAHAYLSLVLAMGHLVGLISDENLIEEATAAAEKAIALDSQDSDVLGYAGCALADMGDLQRGIGMLRRSVELNPSNAQARAALGAALLRADDVEGIEEMQEGIRLSPRDNRIAAWGAILARALLNLDRIEEARDIATKSCQCDDKIFLPRIVLAIACHLMNDIEGAKSALEDARRLRKELSKDDISHFARPEELDGLVSAGLL